jgi:hypothetical protein
VALPELAPELPCTASALVADLVDGPVIRLREVLRTRVSVHYETGDLRVPWLCLCTPEAVRLPHAVVVATLPRANPAGGSDDAGRAGEHRLEAGGTTYRVRRWWTPPRPTGLTNPRPDTLTQAAGLLAAPRNPALDRARDAVLGLDAPWTSALDPERLVGVGPGLTPCGDDLLAGVLVAAAATADPRVRGWRVGVRRALRSRSTTAVSAAMLHWALAGYATPQLARFVTAACTGADVDNALSDLLAVGHSSGTALAAGALRVWSTSPLEGAA